MSIETEEELAGLRRAGRAVAITLREVRHQVRPGITTGELDRRAERTLARLGARPAPRLLYGFPGAICVSVNDEAVHGIPGRRRLGTGDLVKLDVTAELCGHGIGRAIHEEPSVPNVYVRGLDRPLTPGLVITIEPVIAAGGGTLRPAGGWTETAADGSLVAHVEHTIAITRGYPLVLTAA